MAKAFKKSSFCILGGCMEVAIKTKGVSIRKSTNRKKVLHFSKKEWKDFLKGVKNGEFDLV